MEASGTFKAVFIIANAGYADTIMDIVRSVGVSGATIINARGGGGAHHESFLGITLESEKEIIMSIVDADTAQRVMAVIEEKAGWKSSLRGVCFVMPVDRLIGINSPMIKNTSPD